MKNIKLTIIDLLQELVEKELTVDELEVPISDVGVDSLMALEVAVSLEREFNVYLTEEDLANLENINSLIALVESRAV